MCMEKNKQTQTQILDTEKYQIVKGSKLEFELRLWTMTAIGVIGGLIFGYLIWGAK